MENTYSNVNRILISELYLSVKCDQFYKNIFCCKDRKVFFVQNFRGSGCMKFYQSMDFYIFYCIQKFIFLSFQICSIFIYDKDSSDCLGFLKCSFFFNELHNFYAVLVSLNKFFLLKRLHLYSLRNQFFITQTGFNVGPIKHSRHIFHNDK